MTQPSLNAKQLAELAEILEIAIITEQKARKMSEMATAIAQKSQKRINEFRQAAIEKQEA